MSYDTTHHYRIRVWRLRYNRKDQPHIPRFFTPANGSPSEIYIANKTDGYDMVIKPQRMPYPISRPLNQGKGISRNQRMPYPIGRPLNQGKGITKASFME